jgi:hypothetical protein
MMGRDTFLVLLLYDGPALVYSGDVKLEVRGPHRARPNLLFGPANEFC